MCDYRAINNKILNEHKNGVHLKVKNNKCEICEFATAYKQTLSDHVRFLPASARCRWRRNLHNTTKPVILTALLGMTWNPIWDPGLIWNPDLGPQYGTPIWDPNLGPRFGTPI
jgi:hypothetical protein